MARIGPGAEVTSLAGSIQVNAASSDLPETSSSGIVISDPGAKNVRENGLSAAVSVGQFENNAEAYLGAGAIVTAAQGDLLINSRTEIPWEQQWWKWNGMKTFTDKLNFNLGVQNGLFTSWAEAYAFGTKRSFGGSINLLLINGASEAYIGEGAMVNVGFDTSVIATNENDTVNFAGQFLFAFLGFGAVSGGAGVGGSVIVLDYTNTNTATIKDNAVVNTGSLLVMARSDERSINIATQGGKADGFAFNGAATALLVDNQTLARIDDGAKITTGTEFVKVPIDFDSVTPSGNTLFSDVSQFFPGEEFDTDSDENPLTRVNVSADTITLPYDPGFTSGQALLYFHGEDGVDIGGLSDRSRYYAVGVDENTLQLQAELGDTDPVDLNLTNTAGVGHTLFPGFDPRGSGVIDDVTNQINVGYDHSLVDRQRVTYFNKEQSASDIPGLVDGTRYVVDVIDDTTFKLISEFDEQDYFADPDSRQDLVINISRPVAGAGISHFLVPLTTSTTALSGSVSADDLPAITLSNSLASLDSNDDGEVNTSDERIVSVGPDNYVTNLSLLVLADDNAGLYSGTGAMSLGRNIGVGVAASIKDIRRSTEALLGKGLEVPLTVDGVSAPGVGVDSQDEIFLGYDHGLSQGDQVTYSSGGDFVIGGLQDGETYFVNTVSDSDSSGDPTLKLARTAAEANELSSTRFSASDVTDTAGIEIIELGYEHDFQLGDAVRYRSGSGSPIGGLADGQVYYVIPTSSTSVALTESPDIALDGFDTVFDPAESVDGDTIVFSYEHEFTAGQPVRYTAGGGTAFGSLVDGQTYFIDVIDENTIELQDSSGTTISLNSGSGAIGRVHTLDPGTILNNTDVDGTTNTLDLKYFHGYKNGEPIVYRAGQTPLTGLSDGQVYYAIVDGEESIALAATQADADATVSPLQYRDPNTNLLVDMTEGQTFYAIPVASGKFIVQPDDSQISLSIEMQLSLTPNGSALELDGSTSEGVHSFRLSGTRLDISVPVADQAHYFKQVNRLDLDATQGSGNDQTLRLALDPSTAVQITHGLGRIFTASSAVDSDTDEIDLGYEHGFVSGDAVVYSSGGLSNEIGGLGSGNIYYVVVVNDTTVQLVQSQQEAFVTDPQVVDLDGSGASGAEHGLGRVIRPQVVVDSLQNTIDFGQGHNYSTGDQVVYSASDGAAIGGLTEGATYFVINVGGTTIQLAETLTDATAAMPIAIDLDGTLATGGDQLFTDPVGSGFVITGGDGLVVANNGGEIVSLSLAASIVTKSRGGALQSGAVTAADAAAEDNQPRYGLSLAGDFTFNFITDTTKAIVDSTSIDANSLAVSARNNSLIGSGSGAIAIASSTTDSKGIAGSFTSNVIRNITPAQINNASVTAEGNVSVDALTSSEIIAVGISGASVNGALALAGSVVANVISNTTQAIIANSTVVTDNLVEATLGAGVTVQANADTSIAALTVRTGEIDDDFNKLTESARGVIVTAVSLDEIISVAAGGSVAGTSGAAIAGSATVTRLNEVALATIGAGAQVNQATTGESISQSVLVRAGERTELSGVAGAAAVSFGGAGIGAGADVAIINKDVTASIGRAANVEARNNVMVEAISFEDALSVAASAGVGKSYGVAGALGVLVYDIDTLAFIQGDHRRLGRCQCTGRCYRHRL